MPNLQAIAIAAAAAFVVGAGSSGLAVWKLRAAEVTLARLDADKQREEAARLDNIIARQQRADAELRRSLDSLRAGVDLLRQDGARRSTEGATGLAAVRQGLDTTRATIAALTARIQAPVPMLTCADALAEWRTELH